MKHLYLAAFLSLLTPLAIHAADNPLIEEDVRTPIVPIQPNQELTVNAYIGMVNGEPIFVEGVLRPVDAELRRIARVARNITDFRELAKDTITKQLNIQISDLIIIKAAKDALTEDDNRKIDAYMNKITKDTLTKYEGSIAKADLSLRAQGSSYEKELADKKRRAIIDLYLQKVLWPKIVVTRKMVLEEYERNIAKFSLPAEVDLYTITVPVSRFLKETTPDGEKRTIKNPTATQIQEADNLAKARVEELIGQLKNGGDFAELATNNSADPKAKDGGRWQHTRKGMLALQPIEDAAFALPPNTIAPPVHIVNADPARSAWVIVKVAEATPARVIPFPEAQATIEKKLRETQYVQLTNDYYTKLRAKAAVEMVDRMIDTATDAAITRYLTK